MLIHRMRVLVYLTLGLALATGCGREDPADSQGTGQTASSDFRDLNGNGKLDPYEDTRKLAPGESQDLEFTLDAASLASFDPDRSAWIADAGTYKVSVGASSRDLRSAATFDLRREVVVEKTLADLSPERRLEELDGRNGS